MNKAAGIVSLTSMFRSFLISAALLLYCFSSQGQVWKTFREGYHNSMTHWNGKTYITLGGFQGRTPSIAVSENDTIWTETQLPEGSPRPGTPIFFDDDNGIITQLFITGEDSRMWSTADGGQSWELYQPNYDTDSFTPQIIERVDDQTVVGRHRSNLYISFDRGRNWTIKSLSQAFITTVDDMELYGLDEWFLSSDRNGIYKSTDQGDSWEQVFTLPVEAFQMRTPSLGYAIGPTGESGYEEIVLYKTEDGWNTYETLTFELPENQWTYVFHVTEDEAFGFFQNDAFYMVRDINTPGAQPVLYQQFRVTAQRMLQFGDKFYIRDLEAHIGLDSEALASPHESVVTSIDEEDLSNPLVYPNPAENEIQVSDSRYDDFELISPSGLILSQGGISNGQITLGHQPTGIYILRLADREAQAPPRSVKLRLN